MTDPGELTRIAERLEELAALLRDPAVADERAAELAAEAAELASRARDEADAALRAGEPIPGQEELL